MVPGRMPDQTHGETCGANCAEESGNNYEHDGRQGTRRRAMLRVGCRAMPKRDVESDDGKGFLSTSNQRPPDFGMLREEPEHPWEFRFGRKRRALTQEARVERMEWARRLLREKKAAAWFFTNIIWIDLCSKAIPGNPKKAGKKGRDEGRGGLDGSVKL